MPDIIGDRVVKTDSQFSIPEVSSADITWSITGSDKITIDQSGVISVPSYTRTPSAEMTVTATIAGVPIDKRVYYLADYLEGNSVINGNTDREFYCYTPT